MSSYYEVKYAVKGKDGKTFWNRCGTAFPSKQGDGFSIILDAVPVATENGQIRLAAFPPRERENVRQAPADDYARSKGDGARQSFPLDDEIPF